MIPNLGIFVIFKNTVFFLNLLNILLVDDNESTLGKGIDFFRIPKNENM